MMKSRYPSVRLGSQHEFRYNSLTTAEFQYLNKPDVDRYYMHDVGVPVIYVNPQTNITPAVSFKCPRLKKDSNLNAGNFYNADADKTQDVPLYNGRPRRPRAPCFLSTLAIPYNNRVSTPM